MGVASMDLFLKSLLVEQRQLRSVSGCCTNDCIVVVDNARLHPTSWSELPTRLRENLTLKSDPIHSTPPLRRRIKKRQQAVSSSCSRPHSLSDPCQTRWGSTTTKVNNRKKKQQPALKPTAAPTPPSCPQRQQSIEVPPQQQQPEHWESSPSSVTDPLLEEGPKMPKRQASVALEGTDALPPPPMTIMATTPSLPPPMSLPVRSHSANNNSSLMMFSPDFSKKVKRSSVSLLDDDDDSDSEDESATVRSFRSIRSF